MEEEQIDEQQYDEQYEDYQEKVTVCALLLWLVRLWVKPDLALLWPPVAWAVAAFLGYARDGRRGDIRQVIARRTRRPGAVRRRHEVERGRRARRGTVDRRRRGWGSDAPRSGLPPGRARGGDAGPGLRGRCPSSTTRRRKSASRSSTTAPASPADSADLPRCRQTRLPRRTADGPCTAGPRARNTGAASNRRSSSAPQRWSHRTTRF